MALSDRDRAILDFERTWWTLPGPKEVAIREQLDLSATRYYEVLNGLIDDDDAVEYDPLLVKRLRRLRARRRRQRYESAPAGAPRQR